MRTAGCAGGEFGGSNMLVRAAFWLSVGYLVVQPGQFAPAERAADMANALMQSGAPELAQRAAYEICSLSCQSAQVPGIQVAVLTSKPDAYQDRLFSQLDVTNAPDAPVPPPRSSGAR